MPPMPPISLPPGPKVPRFFSVDSVPKTEVEILPTVVLFVLFNVLCVVVMYV
jgi:hypothetical protein